MMSMGIRLEMRCCSRCRCFAIAAACQRFDLSLGWRRISGDGATGWQQPAAQDNLQKLAGTLVSRAFSHLGPRLRRPGPGHHQCRSTDASQRMDIQTCVDEADQALLQAKRRRNRVGCRQVRQRDRFDVSMAQPGGVELGVSRGWRLNSVVPAGLVTLTATAVSLEAVARWCQSCPHAAPESLWHLDHRGDEDVSQHTLNERIIDCVISAYKNALA